MTALLTVCHCQKLLTIPTTIMATWTMTMLEYWPQFLDGVPFHLEATSQLFSMRLM